MTVYILQTAIAAETVKRTNDMFFFLLKDKTTDMQRSIAAIIKAAAVLINKSQISPARYEKPIKPDLCFIILLSLIILDAKIFTNTLKLSP